MSKQARIRTQELRKAQEEAARKQARRRAVAMVLGGVVILGLVAAIIFAVVKATGGDDGPTKALDDVTVPSNVTSTGAIPVGEDDAPVTVEIYYDYMCPACGAFEAANSVELDRLIEEGVAQVELRPISFLDEQSDGTEYSTRTANAMATVADAAPDSVWDFHAALYANQPQEGSEGLSDDQIGDIAREVGVSSEVVDRFDDGTYAPWVAAVTDLAFDNGVQGTPTVKVNGEEFDGDLYTEGVLTEAIESAADGE
ncbi:thioredoxin domain-containing protein [Nocardioides sp.]|uniref:DsbA family protein n=1 Tax=Nocardioides sp. TaxID=35761 RepID=UPI0027362217|nr:thioredoxin domain-containing protein [Nocardioides sp.]MDP3891890.1 thioredoxin domain-containing protein [Nocardioides sp.]